MATKHHILSLFSLLKKQTSREINEVDTKVFLRTISRINEIFKGRQEAKVREERDVFLKTQRAGILNPWDVVWGSTISPCEDFM